MSPIRWPGSYPRAKAACAEGTEGMIGRLKLEELGMKPSPLFERSAAGLCEESKN